MCMKYLVDCYNLSYFYGKCDTPTSVHASAVNYFFLGIIIQNVLMIFFFSIRLGEFSALCPLPLLFFLFTKKKSVARNRNYGPAVRGKILCAIVDGSGEDTVGLIGLEQNF